MNDPVETDLLHFAVQDGDLAKVKELVAAGEPINGFDDTHKTPLHYAVGAQRLDIAQGLLDAGADVNARDEDHIGDTAFGDVAASCSLEVARSSLRPERTPPFPIGCNSRLSIEPPNESGRRVVRYSNYSDPPPGGGGKLAHHDAGMPRPMLPNRRSGRRERPPLH